MEFKSFTKIPRFSREMIVTEKIDGTNGIIAIGENGEFQVGSRNKWLTDEMGNIQSDNAGFAQWAIKNRDSLMALGVGFHYGDKLTPGLSLPVRPTKHAVDVATPAPSSRSFLQSLFYNLRSLLASPRN